jgi:hypothetical protein
MTWLVLFLAVAADDPTISGSNRRAVSENFQIDCRSPRHDARLVAKSCEQWRRRLLLTWRPQDQEANWKVDCQVIVHSSRQSYLGAVGRGGQYSLGSSWLEFEKKLVSKRVIDLLPDSSGELDALAHELTHVVVADYFDGKQLPRWADEGMAILADSNEKRRLHQRDLHQAIGQQKTFHAAQLLAVTDYPEATRIPTFYGQSASLVAFLCKRDKPAKFLEFVQLSMQKGHETSIREVYGLNGHAELEHRWRQDLAGAVDFHGFRLALMETRRGEATLPE